MRTDIPANKATDADRRNAALYANSLYRWYNACPVELEDEANERLLDQLNDAMEDAMELCGVTPNEDDADGIEAIRGWMRSEGLVFSE
jgi:hypothetical protein